MEASGKPPPQTLPPEGEEAPPAGQEQAEGGTLRRLAVLLAVALAFTAAILIVLAVNTADLSTREDCEVDPACTEYFDGGSAQKATSAALLGLGGGVALAGVIVCLLIAARGAGARWMLPVAGAAILFGAIGVVVANV